MFRRCTKDKIAVFSKTAEKLINAIGNWQYNSSFRNVKIDPLSDAVLFIVANATKMTTKDFLGCIRPGKIMYPYRITEIKSFKSYREVKKIFDDLKLK